MRTRRLALLGAAPSAARPAPRARALAEARREGRHPLHRRRTLPNGLTVILSEDHALPLVAVNTMVRVGSRFEEAGRTGFAHLFEHLMFMGTARAPDQDVRRLDGGRGRLATTPGPARIAPTTTTSAPRTTLPLLLWLEADRLSSLGQEMTQREARRRSATWCATSGGRRTRTSRTARSSSRLPELLYPAGHPYHHPVIGSHEDLRRRRWTT